MTDWVVQSYQAVPKRDDDDKTPSPSLYQENVFVEASRPKYLENLHSEAREGLKMMQEEETNNGVEFRDNESTISTMTVQTDGEGFMTDSTMGDTSSVVSVKSSVSTRSSRSGLTRQESTFRPLSSEKKTKTRRRHRRTVVGIPQHVQRELGMDRAGWSRTPRLDEEQLYNGETDDSSTTDGPERAAGSQKGGSSTLLNINDTRPLNKEQLKQLGDHAGHQDRLGPWMAGANSLQQPPSSAVMSMSPQAAYMSKIIPNAVLPPSIEVVEISRGQSRNSVRTVSKSSLMLSSPSPSRTSSRSSNVTSASRYNPINMSDSSCWSNSESSETLVSDSSTISRNSTPNQRRSQEREDKISVHSSISKASKSTSNGKLIINGEGVKKEGPFVRSLSVMKSKRAPPPPSRSYSLHNKMKRRSRDLAELKINAGESSIHNRSASGAENETNKLGYSPVPTRTRDSPGYTADTSSLEDSIGSASFSLIRSQVQALKAERAAKVEDRGKLPLENEQSKVVSPSSGYSSQDGASSQVPKQSNKKGILAKLHRFFPGSSPLPQPDTSADIVNISPSVRALRELFNIPPPPKVHAPPAPPPEVWAHSKRSFELLLGPPAPDNLEAIIKKNPKDRRPRQSPSTSAESSVKSLVMERKHKKPAVTVESVNKFQNVLETKKDQESGIVSAEKHMENNRLAQPNVHLNGKSKVTEQVEETQVSEIINGILVKAVEKRDGRLEAVREEVEAKNTSTQTSEVKQSRMDTLPAILLARILPPPSSPLGPPSHPAQQTTMSPESSWPPPPPPLVGLNGPDEMDFPLPPPPIIGEGGLVMPVQVPPERPTPGGDSSCTTTSVLSGVAPPPPSIPPPPPYTAPAPPLKAVSPSTIKKVSPSPPPKEVTLLPPLKEETLPPPPKVGTTLPPPPKEETPPPPPKVVTTPPPPSKEETSPPPPKVVTTPPPPSKEETPSPPPKVVTTPPPAPKEETSPPPPKVVTTPPPPSKEETPSPPPKVVTTPPPAPKEETPPPPPKVVTTPPPAPKKVTSPAPPIGVSSPPLKEASPTLVVDGSVTLVAVVSSSPQPPTEVSTKLTPPQSIPPPPPFPSQSKSEQEIDPPQGSIPSQSETSPVSSYSILTPPQSIPPPPPIQLLHQPQVGPQNKDGPATQEPPPLALSEVLIRPALENCPEKSQEPALSPPVNIPSPGLASIKDRSSPAITENQPPELASAAVVQEDHSPDLTPSTKSGAETLDAQKPPEVTLRKQQPSNPVPTSSASGEAPQKPIRRSLIIINAPSPPPATSPPSSPPPTVTAQPALPNSQSLLVLPAVVSPTKKSATTGSPSMNLQEAIRLRTAARSKAVPSSRLSLNSPTSPGDLRKSPSCTASFIFSKSNKKVAIETKPALEAMGTVEKKLEESSVTKGDKMPPPVAKKPKPKGNGTEANEGTEQTAGQGALQESITNAAETNGTAGTVEGGTPST
uniref:KIAA1522 n=1 Tax=Gasterosteus aculeatus aculeatus TaxID=481459 RepID=A0AAQ4PLK2_GASAC